MKISWNRSNPVHLVDIDVQVEKKNSLLARQRTHMGTLLPRTSPGGTRLGSCCSSSRAWVFPLSQTICPNLSSFCLQVWRRTSPSSARHPVLVLRAHSQPSLPHSTKLPAPFCCFTGLLLVAKHKETWAPSPVLDELPVPPHSPELVWSYIRESWKAEGKQGACEWETKANESN